MGFQIYQREKSQAIDLLDRIACRICDAQVEEWTEDGQDALNDVTRLCREVENKRTQLNREVPVDLATLASLLRNFDDQKRGTAAEWFATYFSNYNTDRDEFLLAAGYTLPERDQLLREEECAHGDSIGSWAMPSGHCTSCGKAVR